MCCSHSLWKELDPRALSVYVNVVSVNLQKLGSKGNKRHQQSKPRPHLSPLESFLSVTRLEALSFQVTSQFSSLLQKRIFAENWALLSASYQKIDDEQFTKAFKEFIRCNETFIEPLPRSNRHPFSDTFSLSLTVKTASDSLALFFSIIQSPQGALFEEHRTGSISEHVSCRNRLINVSQKCLGEDLTVSIRSMKMFKALRFSIALIFFLFFI